VEISFVNKSLQKSCNSERELKRNWGNDRAKKIERRLRELVAADSLEEMSFVPSANFHELKGPKAGKCVVDVSKNFRLVFEPDHDPVPLKEDGGIDLKRVVEIKILEIEDYHGK
jgi:proteic killer suppression protein